MNAYYIGRKTLLYFQCIQCVRIRCDLMLSYPSKDKRCTNTIWGKLHIVSSVTLYCKQSKFYSIFSWVCSETNALLMDASFQQQKSWWIQKQWQIHTYIWFAFNGFFAFLRVVFWLNHQRNWMDRRNVKSSKKNSCNLQLCEIHDKKKSSMCQYLV